MSNFRTKNASPIHRLLGGHHTCNLRQRGRVKATAWNSEMWRILSFFPSLPTLAPPCVRIFSSFFPGFLIAACCSGSKLELFNSYLVHGGIGQLSSTLPPMSGVTWYHSLRLFHTMDLTKVKPPTDDPIIAIKSTNNRLLSCIRFMISHYFLQSGSSYHMSLFRIRYPKLDPPIGRPVLKFNVTQVSTGSSGFQTLKFALGLFLEGIHCLARYHVIEGICG